jgi:hypothetical protein
LQAKAGNDKLQEKESQKMNVQNLIRSILSGLGVAVLILLVGIPLDYSITQIVSQVFIRGCSEDCYFRIFNTIFVVIAFLSFAIGLRAAVRSYKRLSE